LDFVRAINESKKLVGAFYRAGYVLISVEIVKWRRVTNYYAVRDDMINARIIFKDSPVGIDNIRITSRMLDDLPELIKIGLNFLTDEN
jgi:protease I